MKVLIALTPYADLVLAVDASNAAAAAALLAQATLLRNKSPFGDAAFEPEPLKLTMTYVDDAAIDTPSAALIEARNKYDAKNSEWATAYNRANTAERRVKELEAQLADQEVAA